MKEFLVLALALTTTATLGVEHQPRNGVEHQPRELLDISSLETHPAPPASARKARQVDPLACGSTDVMGFGEYVVLESPNYPYKRYPNNFDCAWELVVPAGAEVLFSCEYFHVRRGDYFTMGEYQFYGYSSGFSGYQVELLDTQTSINFGFTTNNRRKGWGFRCYVDVEAGDFSTTVAPVTTTANSTSSSTTESSSGCSCGQANQDRIVGGEATDANEYPWQVALVSANGKHPFCGGTLISSQHVLTAAHCTAGSSPSNIAVLVGEHRIDDNSFTRLSLSAITDHPGYNSGTLDNDFSILTLSSPVTFSNAVKPACLPSSTSDYAGQVAVVSGWGTLSSGGNQPTVLNDVSVTVQSNQDCNSAYGGDITSNMICAADAGKDSCQGDSGGPMTVLEGGRYSLVGVVSWGYGCANPSYPGVYARVTAQMDWIKANSAQTCDN